MTAETVELHGLFPIKGRTQASAEIVELYRNYSLLLRFLRSISSLIAGTAGGMVPSRQVAVPSVAGTWKHGRGEPSSRAYRQGSACATTVGLARPGRPAGKPAEARQPVSGKRSGPTVLLPDKRSPRHLLSKTMAYISFLDIGREIGRQTMTKLVNGRMVGRRALALPPNGLEIIRDLASKGMTNEGISYALGLARDGLTKLKTRDKTGAIEQALFEGRQREHDSLYSALFRKATEGNGKDSVIAAIFLLKTRHGYVEPREPFPVGPAVNIEIRVPGSLKPEDYAKLITQVPASERPALEQA